MTAEEVLKTIGEIGVVPVAVLDDPDTATPAARALLAGGVATMEITFRTPSAAESISRVAREAPEMLVGAGTVTSVELARAACSAGAAYIVSPGLNPYVVQWCRQNGVPVLPGVATPSEVETAMELGLDTLKFFPASAAGGVPMLKALAGPYGGIHFVPTGGIGPENMNDYLACSNVVAVGGGWLLPKDALAAGDYERITRLAAEAMARLHGFSLLHIGINTSGGPEAKTVADAFCTLFGLACTETPKAYFAGTAAEVMKGSSFGEKGHLAFACNNVERAAAYFRRCGIEFTDEGLVRDKKGLVVLYFKQSIAGFAIHLRRKP